MTGKKDSFWKYADNIQDDGFSCTFCHHHFRGRVSVARLKSHLAGEKGRNTQVCVKVPDDVRWAALQSIDASKKKGKSMGSSDHVEECAISSPSSSIVKGVHQPMPKICKKDRSAVDRKLHRCMVLNGLPFDLIRTQSFIDFAKSLTEFGPSYEPPTFSNFQESSMIYVGEVDSYISRVRKSLAETACTLITDCWDDDLCNTWINIFICSARGPILEKSCLCSKNERLLSDTLDTLRPGGHVIQYFVGGSHDTSFLIEDLPKSTCCASLEIESLLLRICEVEWISDVFQLAALVANYVERDGNMSSRIEHYQSKEYSNSDLTKYASRYLMLQSILNIESELKASQLPSTHYTSKILTQIFHHSKFWSVGKEVVEVLQPIFQVLNLVEEYWSTSGYLYEAFKRAKDKIFMCFPMDPEKNDHLCTQFVDCQKKIIQPMHKAAAFLNPDYKYSEYLDDNEIKEGMDYILDRSVNLEEREALRTQIESYCNLRPLLTMRTMKITVHPHTWWGKCEDSLHVLRKYAIQILSQPCSLLSCHQYRMKHICSTDQYKLGVNTMLMEKYSKLEARNEEPIHLDKISGLPEYADNQDSNMKMISEDEVLRLVQDGIYDRIIHRLTPSDINFLTNVPQWLDFNILDFCLGMSSPSWDLDPGWTSSSKFDAAMPTAPRNGSFTTSSRKIDAATSTCGDTDTTSSPGNCSFTASCSSWYDSPK